MEGGPGSQKLGRPEIAAGLAKFASEAKTRSRRTLRRPRGVCVCDEGARAVVPRVDVRMPVWLQRCVENGRRSRWTFCYTEAIASLEESLRLATSRWSVAFKDGLSVTAVDACSAWWRKKVFWTKRALREPSASSLPRAIAERGDFLFGSSAEMDAYTPIARFK